MTSFTEWFQCLETSSLVSASVLGHPGSAKSALSILLAHPCPTVALGDGRCLQAVFPPGGRAVCGAEGGDGEGVWATLSKKCRLSKDSAPELGSWHAPVPWLLAWQ